MATIINADTSDGLKLTSDTSGEIQFQSGGTTKMTVGSSGVTGIPLGTKNLIINGDMRIAQRGTSVSATNSNGYNTVDRFRMDLGVGTLGSYDVSQSTDAPNGFSNSLKLEVATAEASPASNAYSYIAYNFEGQDLQGVSKGNSDAKPLTLSFWVKSSKTGNVQVNLRDLDNSRLVGQTFSINSANTWEYKTVTYPADTSGSLDNDNNASLRVVWWLDSGSNYNTGSTPTTWETLANADRAVGTDLSFADTVGATFYITGVQLEVGDTATDFEHLQYGQQLALCQRYFQICGFHGVAYNTTEMGIASQFKVNMRTQPSMSTVLYNTDNYTGSANTIFRVGVGNTATTSASYNAASSGNNIGNILTTGLTANNIYFGSFQASAEL